MLRALTQSLGFATAVSGAAIALRQADASPESCPGYSASNVEQTGTGLTADLELAGPACNAYGTDIESLRLSVNYDSAQRLNVKIEDAAQIAYQVPTSVFPLPDTSASVSADDADLEFTWEASPFSFKVVRKSNQEVLFDSSAAPLVFEDQYVRVRTSLPEDPNLYGLGEHTDPFRLNTTDYVRTLWSRDSYGVPAGTNLYGNHPIYFDHRGEQGTHGVFMLSSSGMAAKINRTESEGQYLEFNMLGGVIDMYFMAGDSPTAVAQQYSEVSGKSTMMPYWGFGLHQCRYGYRDYYAIAEVIYNYSAAAIPLETMWTDIDYMYQRYIMTTDPDRFPIERVRDYVNYLHEHDQHYIVMVDPAMAYQTETYDGLPYETFLRAQEQGILLYKNDSIYRGVVWPGVTAFPDWFHPDTAQYWNNEFLTFFDEETGVDIDALWIDMNEAANFNPFGADPDESAEERGFPPTRPALRSQPRPIPGFPAEFQPDPNSPYPADGLVYAPPWLAPASDPGDNNKRSVQSKPFSKRQAQDVIGYPDRNFLAPPFQIDNANTVGVYGGLSNFTLDTDIIHYDGHVELDVHNLYGKQMSDYSRNAMLARRPERRPMVITRSTFAGAGTTVGKWLGDNLSTWSLYRQSIQGMLDFAALYQMPFVGSDACGFGGNATSTLCARWASLASFSPFFRNHNGDSSIPQEFYLWDVVAESARKSIDIRYRLLDYIYTGLYQQSVEGTPMINPMFFLYPYDKNTFAIDLQYFYGPAILVSPVTEENATSVEVYLPDDRFYDFHTYEIVEGAGANITIDNVDFTEIPLHIRGGSIVAMRTESAMTTTEVRQKPFDIVVAPGRDGKASGSLYLDDGDSIEQPATSMINMSYDDGVLSFTGSFDYNSETTSTTVASVTVLGQGKEEHGLGKPDCSWRKGGHGDKDRGHGRGGRGGKGQGWNKFAQDKVAVNDKSMVIEVDQALDGEFELSL